MDKGTRNTLRNVVTRCRRLLEDAVAELLEGRYGIHKNGTIESAEALGALSDEESRRRERVLARLAHLFATGDNKDEAVARLVREIAFTHLNRLVAYKMMEERGLIREAVSRGMSSQGFQFFLADNPAEAALRADGQEYVAYCHFLDSLGSGFSSEITALFSDADPANGLYAGEKVLLEMLGLINQAELESIWAEDEAIGWVYQYFTPKELRDQARKQSLAPRNSYELAFLNQFYTPRYVVQFLVDNTLGRLWNEICGSASTLADGLTYLALPDEGATGEPGGGRVREPRDPRTMKVLDPACGSGHFLLYCFDLFERIYHEAYGHPQAGSQLRADFPDPTEFNKAVPGLILGNNLHGIDIDPRAVQISALALWLRAQRSYQEAGIGRNGRPPITRANVVCAEPMPGEVDLLNQFVEDLEPPLLRQLVRDMFGRMKLASEAGSLLRIEEELRASLHEAKVIWLGRPRQEQLELLPELRAKAQTQLAFDVSGITDAEFWDSAEERVLDALRHFAEEAETEQGYLRRLFADDVARGFAFIDLCRKRYDVVLMNPPFGAAPPKVATYLDASYPNWAGNILCSFFMRSRDLLKAEGLLGAIFDRTASIKSSYEKFRRNHLNDFIVVCADTGWGVLDAEVETTVCVLESQQQDSAVPFVDLRDAKPEDRPQELAESMDLLRRGTIGPRVYMVVPGLFSRLPNAVVGYYFDELLIHLFTSSPSLQEAGLQARQGDALVSDEHFRTYWEVKNACEVGKGLRFSLLYNGSGFSMFCAPYRDVTLYGFEGSLVKEHPSVVLRNPRFQYLQGVGYGKRGDVLDAHALPSGFVFTSEGQAITGLAEEQALLGLAFLNSSIAQYCINQYCGQHKHCGYVNLLPFLRPQEEDGAAAIDNTLEILALKTDWFSQDETTLDFRSPCFCSLTNVPLPLPKEMRQRVQSQLVRDSHALEQKIAINDGLFARAGGVTSGQMARLEEFSGHRPQDTLCPELETDRTEQGAFLAHVVLSHALGFVLGRWDVRLVTGQRALGAVRRPYDPVSTCPPAMLEDEEGLPVLSTPLGYPLNIDWDGILVDDPSHPDDIITRLRQALEATYGARAGTAEAELGELLRVSDLRDYFRRPTKGGFWLDHVARYSKSRRKAPIYWLLQSKKRSYALWLYYHRLDRDLLYKALVNYVEPKLRLEESRLKELEEARILAGPTGRESKQLARETEAQEELVQEITEFAQALSRAAELHLIPDLDDGVLLNIAPLWELVPWKEAATTWQELLKGKYPWSSVGQQLRERGVVKS